MSENGAVNIVEFLEACMAEDEARANYYGSLAMGTARVLAECAAKRAIVKLAEGVESLDYQVTSEWGGEIDGTADDIIRALAAVYKDHPGYQQEWAE
jgi:hypothetical protein